MADGWSVAGCRVSPVIGQGHIGISHDRMGSKRGQDVSKHDMFGMITSTTFNWPTVLQRCDLPVLGVIWPVRVEQGVADGTRFPNAVLYLKNTSVSRSNGGLLMDTLSLDARWVGSDKAAVSSVRQVSMSFSVRGESMGAQWKGMTFFNMPASEVRFWILSWAMFLSLVTTSSSASQESSMATAS